MSDYNCDHCKFYSWYFDRCGKWDCKVDAREVHNCFESSKLNVVRDIMVSCSQPKDTATWKCSDDFFETGICPYCGYDTEEPYEYAKENLSECPKCGAKIETGHTNELR